jgi:hypothetical protein
MRPPTAREARADSAGGKVNLSAEIGAVGEERCDCGSSITAVPGEGFVDFIAVWFCRFCAHVPVLLCCCHSRHKISFFDVAFLVCSLWEKSQGGGGNIPMMSGDPASKLA